MATVLYDSHCRLFVGIIKSSYKISTLLSYFTIVKSKSVVNNALSNVISAPVRNGRNFLALLGELSLEKGVGDYDIWTLTRLFM